MTIISTRVPWIWSILNIEIKSKQKKFMYKYELYNSLPFVVSFSSKKQFLCCFCHDGQVSFPMENTYTI